METAVATLEAVLGDVTDIDPGELSDGEVHRVLLGLLEQRNAVDAAICRLTAEWTARGIWAEDGSRAAGARLARDARLRRPAADKVVRLAAAVTAMPEVAAALRAGTITVDHVELLAAANAAHRRDDFVRDDSSSSVSSCTIGRRRRRCVTGCAGSTP
jgi:hypothetical protein